MSTTPYELYATPQGIPHITSGPQEHKTTLVCIHGWACQATDYTRLFHELQRIDVQARRVAIDLPGNNSSFVANNATIPKVAAAVVSVLIELQLGDVVLVGHSMGVRIILECWRQLQIPFQTHGLTKVLGLVFLDGSHYKLRKKLFAFDKGDARSRMLTNDEKVAGMSEAFKRMFSEHTPPDFQEATLEHLRTMDLEYNELLRAAFIKWDHEQMDNVMTMLGESCTPLINVTSTDIDEDNNRIPMEPFEVSRWMQFVKEKVPRVQLTVVRNVMHFPHVDAPDTIAKILKRFLEWDLGYHIE